MRMEHAIDPNLNLAIEWSEVTGWRVEVKASVNWLCLIGKEHAVPIDVVRRIDTVSTDRVLFSTFDAAIGNEPGAVLRLVQLIIDDEISSFADPCMAGLTGEDFL